MNRKLKIENLTFALRHTDGLFTTQSVKTVGACRRSSREYP